MGDDFKKSAVGGQYTAEIIPFPHERASRRNVAMERSDIEWHVEGGFERLRFRETRAEYVFKRLRNRQITQEQIDRMPERLRRVAWNMCLLNYDYEGRYYLPKPSIHDWVDNGPDGQEPCTPEQAAAIMKQFGIRNMAGLEADA